MELYIEPERKPYNPTNGRFLKGHVPHNKGRKWEDYMTEEAIENSKKGWRNLEKSHAVGHPYVEGCGRKRVKVVAVGDNGKFTVFGSMNLAAERVGGNDMNVKRCCRCNEKRHVNKKTGKINTDHRYNGVRFYFESDPIWMEKIERK